jgi:hypothetical protein
VAARSAWDLERRSTGRSRRVIAESLFERIEVLELRRMRIIPTDAAVARGLADAFSSASAGYGRGERNSAVTSDAEVHVRFVRKNTATTVGRTA